MDERFVSEKISPHFVSQHIFCRPSASRIYAHSRTPPVLSFFENCVCRMTLAFEFKNLTYTYGPASFLKFLNGIFNCLCLRKACCLLHHHHHPVLLLMMTPLNRLESSENEKFTIRALFVKHILIRYFLFYSFFQFKFQI